MEGTKKSKEEIDSYVDELYKKNPDKFADLAVDIQEKMAQSVGQEEKIRALPMEDTIWFIVELETGWCFIVLCEIQIFSLPWSKCKLNFESYLLF